MKRSDIDDQHVLDLAGQARAEGFTPNLLERLQAEGIPHKVALAKIEHMCSRDLLDYGVSPAFAWPIDEET